ncbi:MAG: sigma 54-interacting transcriptional regulator [Rhodospirillales bacterium]|nr:sigma 54-interacting transcriptional regulator [Rhodospirillales bacterium]
MQFKTVESNDALPRMDDILQSLDAPEFGSVMDRMIDGVIILDADGLVRTLNSTAIHLNGLENASVIGRSYDDLLAESTLDWSESLDEVTAQRKREFIALSDSGRSILVSVRYLRDTVGDATLTIMFLRDLQVFDHLRRTATGVSGGNVFKFLSDRDIGPDFDAQRHLSKDVDRMILRGTRSLHQGARLLLMGESGSGKTELAKYLHRSVGTREEAFIHVNCGAIPDSLFESEMFGYEKGAFTGALQTGKRGLIESAEGGTLFLDEIGEIPLSSQAKLLKFLEDGIVQRVGGRVGKKVNARIISATNRNLWQLVAENQFRRDLYYRLAVITLEGTPLREQHDLIDHLIDHFVSAANRMRKPDLTIADDCRTNLKEYPFPGNIRELHNLIQHLSVVADDTATAEHLPAHVCEPQDTDIPSSVTKSPEPIAASRPLKEQVRVFERQLIDRAITRLGSKRKAARALGVDIGTIVRKTQHGEQIS